MLLQYSAVWLGALSKWMTSPPGRKLQISVASWLRLALQVTDWVTSWQHAMCLCVKPTIDGTSGERLSVYSGDRL